jgi:N-acetylglucosaminyldiphosphoundecaprenol N-acetyl-beta-D-mannosaminyltransferase
VAVALAPRAITIPAWSVEDVRAYSAQEIVRTRVELGGVLIDQQDFEGAVERLRAFSRSGSPHQVVTVNLDFLAIARRDATFAETVNQADLAVADGMPLVWASRLGNEPLAERLAGVELVDACCSLAARSDQGVFLLGGGPGVAEAAARRLEARHPRLRVAGVYSPPFGPFTPEEDERIVRLIRAASPGFLFVALGAPRQDLWIHSHLEELGVPVSMGVGCVFDLLAGAVNRAPRWMQRCGLEWAFRLLQEPRRLWRRYIIDDLPMFVRLLLSTQRVERSTLKRPASRDLLPSAVAP